MFFMPLAWKKFFLQHAENCVHTSVFARHEPKNTVITVIFATRGKKRRKYRGIGTEAQKKTSVCTVLFAPRVLKKCENTTYVTIFGGPQKCKNTMCCKNNKNKNNTTTRRSSEEAQTCDKKMCYKLRYEKNIVLYSAPARTRRAHEQHQRSHYYT